LLYTYFNVRKIHTQGIETRVRFYPITEINVELNYQLLYSADDEVEKTLNDPNQTKYWKRDGDNDRKVRPDEYGGLMNRSRHSGAVRLTWDNKDLDLYLTLRGVFKSQYGFADANGNTILDVDNPKEYSPGYSMWYISATKKIYKSFSIQAGIDNLADYKTHGTRLITSGRTGYVSLLFNYIFD
jgi:outer membrane receptor for ferrienterochelin and colicins